MRSALRYKPDVLGWRQSSLFRLTSRAVHAKSRNASPRKGAAQSSATQVDDTTQERLNDVLKDLITKKTSSDHILEQRIAALKHRASVVPEPDTLRGTTKTQVHPDHHDVQSFLEYADRRGLDSETTVFKGTLFEYLVADVLKKFGMELTRVGKANDLGIDLLGTWTLPNRSAVPVLIQCKTSKPAPQLIRELEGTCASAPSGWTGLSRLAFLVSRHEATPGVIQALQSSAVPMGFLQITSEGLLRQFIWNSHAADHALTGLGTASRRTARGAASDSSSLVLTWLGRPFASGKGP